MSSHLNVPTKYWELTKEVPPPPVERDRKSWIIGNPSDPVWDIDVLPLTYSDSRWCAFVVRCSEASIRRLVPGPPLEPLPAKDGGDLVEFWYVIHNNTMLGPYLEFGVTIPAVFKGKDKEVKAGYYPYMYLTGDAPVDAGRVLGFPKKMSFIRCTEHGGERATERGHKTNVGNDFFSFAMTRNGYLLHSATGRYDDKDVPAPVFYGKTDWGRFNMKVITEPDVSASKWQLTHLPSTSPFLTSLGVKGHRFMLKPESIRKASGGSIDWFLQATPFDNMGAELEILEVLGLISFTFDLIIPPAEILWEETYERPASWRGFATPYKYGLRQQFPIHQGS